MTKVLLYSGGMDSWLMDKLWKPDVKLYIDIGTNTSKVEITRLPKDVIVKRLDLAEYEDKNKNFLLPLRNLFFVLMGSYYGDEIGIGATASSIHYDNNTSFKMMTEELMNYLYSEAYDKKVKVCLPFLDLDKTDLLAEYLKQGGDINKAWNETFSCYTPVDGKMCGKCSACKAKIEAFKNNGFDYKEEK